MRLLNAETREFREFFGHPPSYAILSHTWGEDEVSFADMKDPSHTTKLGYRKIENCCQKAIQLGFAYVWVDTCCIDKSSSAELTEAINSMFSWYEKSGVCFIYMVDVPPENYSRDNYGAFANSRWFTRGWTLQELLAPYSRLFFDAEWNHINFDKPLQLTPSFRKQLRELENEIWVLERITKIREACLRKYTSFYEYTVAELYWGSSVSTCL
ncbi:Heterokaryon incompatibility domain-containing protein [Madurella fahalii]|uniref:Heterokaryon incompatibility domain-containing protein n=1 Tax=Madurella fahalii TaxID=1157608 RepID=A0ABQ0GL59_9PEZI